MCVRPRLEPPSSPPPPQPKPPLTAGRAPPEHGQVAEEIISLDNGCACCTVRGDLVKALIGLKDRRKDFDAVLLETTGLADPAPILQTFDSNPVLQNNYRIDCVATLVDCKFIQGQLDEVRPEGTVNEAVQQVAFADRVLLNKVDLISPEELRAVKDTVRARTADRTACPLARRRSLPPHSPHAPPPSPGLRDQLVR